MQQQSHLFYNEETQNWAEWTMADVVECGTPVDEDTGDDLEYVGPIVHRIRSVVYVADGEGIVKLDTFSNPAALQRLIIA